MFLFKYLLFVFFLENEGKSVHLQYNDRLRLVGFTQQSLHGPFTNETAFPLGTLDVIGRDRRYNDLTLYLLVIDRNQK
jgi:hypothetical protein